MGRKVGFMPFPKVSVQKLQVPQEKLQNFRGN